MDRQFSESRQQRSDLLNLNDSMTTPPSRKSSFNPHNGTQSPLMGQMTGKRSQIRNSASSRSEHSFSGSDVFAMSLLTSKLADKEKRIEEYKDHI